MSNIEVINACFLNSWGSRRSIELTDFIRRTHQHIDIYCLTEVTHVDDHTAYASTVCHSSPSGREEPPACVDGLQQIVTALPAEFNTQLYSTPTRERWICAETQTVFNDVGFGSALLIKSLKLIIHDTGYVPICLHVKGATHRILQWAVVERNSIRYLVAHIHGLWLKENTKGDDPRREQQSREILESIQELVHEHAVEKVVFGGDLNLDINTRALTLLEEGFLNLGAQRLRNLIRECKIPPKPGTRTKAYRKYDWPGESLYADYALVTNNVAVHEFAVRSAEQCSDHAPLMVSFY